MGGVGEPAVPSLVSYRVAGSPRRHPFHAVGWLAQLYKLENPLEVQKGQTISIQEIIGRLEEPGAPTSGKHGEEEESFE